jgi:hypothetical protein
VVSYGRTTVSLMTALVYGATLNEAAFGDPLRIPMVIAGLALAIGGVCLVCVGLEDREYPNGI